MFVNVSEALNEKIYEALSGEDSAVFRVECKITNPNSGLNITPRLVTGFAIHQDFITKYTDDVRIMVELSIPDFMSLLNNVKDLECTLILQAVNVFFLCDDYDQEPLVFNMRAILPNQEDFQKKFNINAFEDADTGEKTTLEQNIASVPVELQLIDKFIYGLRHRQMNAIFTESTMESVMHWIGQQIGVEKVCAIPPDNPASYSNLVIPPMQSIDTIFPFLQERYGIYSKGLGYYVVNNTLYIYPIHDIDPEKSPDVPVLHIVNCPEFNFGSLDKYHTKKDDDLYIVSNTTVNLKVLNTAGAENSGNVHVSVNADEVFDKFSTYKKGGDVEILPDTLTVLEMQGKSSNMSSDMQNVKFAGETTNLYSATATMAATDGSLMKLGWVRAVPHSIYPGESVIYHYDGEKKEYHTAKGKVLGVTYEAVTHPAVEIQPWFSFTAELSIKLEAENTEQ